MLIDADALIVVDASVVVALLADAGDLGDWASAQVAGCRLVAPDHLHVEVASALRRLERHGRLSLGAATRAHTRALSMPLQLAPYVALSSRVWERRGVLSAYNAAYVALAERLEAPLLTLDAEIADAPGLRCEVRTPDS